MSLQPIAEYRVPNNTARVAHAIFPKGNICLILANELKTFLVDEDFVDLFSRKGRPSESPFLWVNYHRKTFVDVVLPSYKELPKQAQDFFHSL